MAESSPFERLRGLFTRKSDQPSFTFTDLEHKAEELSKNIRALGETNSPRQYKEIQRAIRAIAEGSQSIVYDPTIPPPIMRPDSRGNPYRTYLSAVTAINRKYNNLELYGCALVKEIIDWRTAQIAGNGLNVNTPDKEANDFLQEFVKYNGLGSYRFLEMVREGEMEGKDLLVLEVEDYDGDEADSTYEKMVCVRHVSWLQKGYDVITDDDDYEQVVEVRVPQKIGEAIGTPTVLKPEDVVYVKLGSSKTIVNQCIPRIANVLFHIDNFDRATADIRANNHLFGVATPTIETADESIADKIRKFVYGVTGKLRWVIGTMFIGAGKLSFAEPSGNAVKSLSLECENLAKLITAGVGMPVYLAGYVDLLSNRSTAEELAQMIDPATRIERETWKSKCEELCVKAIKKYNLATGSTISTSGITVSIPIVTEQQIDLIASIYLPLYQAKVISMQTLRTKIPGIDPENEQKLIDQEAKEGMKRAAKMADLMMANNRGQQQLGPDGKPIAPEGGAPGAVIPQVPTKPGAPQIPGKPIAQAAA